MRPEKSPCSGAGFEVKFMAKFDTDGKNLYIDRW